MLQGQLSTDIESLSFSFITYISGKQITCPHWLLENWELSICLWPRDLFLLYKAVCSAICLVVEAHISSSEGNPHNISRASQFYVTLFWIWHHLYLLEAARPWMYIVISVVQHLGAVIAGSRQTAIFVQGELRVHRTLFSFSSQWWRRKQWTQPGWNSWYFMTSK